MPGDIYADVVLPLPGGPFTYRVDEALAAHLGPGMCVEAGFGNRKILTGVVWRLHADAPEYKNLKTIYRRVAHTPVIPERQRAFWDWMASYYMCTPGEVLRAAVPSVLKPKGFSVDEFSRAGYRPRVDKMVSLHPRIDDRSKLDEAFESLRRAPKQYDALIRTVEAAGEGSPGRAVERRLTGADAAVLNRLAAKEIIVLSEREATTDEPAADAACLPVLSPAQREVYLSVTEQFEARDTVLLHGVAGSGKTEIYVRLIADTLARGRDVLYLLPEIALTAQLIRRMEHCFGGRVITYHSGYPERRRTESYLRAARGGGGRLIMGVRSAVFMPSGDLGLVIVDEEHEQSFKQTAPAPRYNARDCALVLASLHGARTLLGSATPSLESYANAQSGKYGFVYLGERYAAAEPPAVVISDTATAVRRGERRTHFNRVLLGGVEAALSGGRQVILLQNRRGYSPYVECPACGWVAVCPHCNVSLTLHRADGRLRCHYCGYGTAMPSTCPSCGGARPVPRGFGTEKVEQELGQIFPHARIDRMDRDSIRSQRELEAIVSRFEAGATDILVGTQMVAKGFDFERVALVGILNADNMLAWPDFRAAERAFQLITQAAGRAGRRGEAASVVIQTTHPDDATIIQAAAGDYRAMAAEQLAQRRRFGYPPFCRIVQLTLCHGDKTLVWRAAELVARHARPLFGARLLGPEPPPVDRAKDQHMAGFMLKIERGSSSARAKAAFADAVGAALSGKELRGVAAVWDVDPV